MRKALKHLLFRQTIKGHSALVAATFHDFPGQVDRLVLVFVDREIADERATG